MKKIVVGFISILVALAVVGALLWFAFSRGDALGLLVCIGGPVAGLFAGQFAYDQLSRLIPARRPRQVDPEQAKRRAQRAAEKEEMRLRIEYAKRHLTGTDWRDSTGKKEFVDELYQGKVPSYLWYVLGYVEPTHDEYQAICRTFWNREYAAGGDCELHKSLNHGVGNVLRIRCAPQFAAEVGVGGENRPLCQIGHGSQDSDQPVVSFRDLLPETELVQS